MFFFCEGSIEALLITFRKIINYRERYKNIMSVSRINSVASNLDEKSDRFFLFFLINLINKRLF